MAEEGTLAINQDVLDSAGEGANSTYTAEAYTNRYIKRAEGFICAQARYDYVTNYSSVSTIGKELLREATASMAAIAVIKQDMSGYTSRTEAQVMIDVLYATVVEVVNILRDDGHRSFVLEGEP